LAHFVLDRREILTVTIKQDKLDANL